MIKKIILFTLLISIIINCSKKEDISKILYYVNPMDPSIKSDKPAKDHMGMDYIPIYESDLAEYENDNTSDFNTATIEKPKEKTTVILSKSDETMIHVKTDTVIFKDLETIIKAYGTISFNEQNIVHVSSRISGRIDTLVVKYAGVKVKKGDLLFMLYSPDVVTAQQELLQNYKSSLAADSSTNIYKKLYESSKNKLLLWGMSKEQINSIQKKNETDQYISVYSPINGTVTKLEINEGMYVNEGTMIYEIVNLDQVWLDAEIYEQDIAYVTENSKVEAISPAYPDTIFTGKILFITPYLEPISRTVKIKANLDNKDGLLKPGMYVSTEFKIPGKKKSLVIPVTALLDTGVRKLVYVSQGNGRYLAKSVIVSPRNGDIIPVLSGLKEGEQIVTYGVFLIDSQAELTGTGYIEYEEPHAKILF